MLHKVDFDVLFGACADIAEIAIPKVQSVRKRRDYATRLLIDALHTRREKVTLAKAKGNRLAYARRHNFGTGNHPDTADDVALSTKVVGETEKSYTLSNGGHVAKNKVLAIVSK